jgi:hypothetical protein
MSIRLLARDLYRVQQEVDRIERALQEAPFDRRSGLEDKLRQARAERARLRRVMEGQKDAPGAARGGRSR